MQKNHIMYTMIRYLILSGLVLFIALAYLVLNRVKAPNYSVSDGYTYSKAEPNYRAIKQQSIEQMESMSLPTKSTDDMAQWAAMVVTRSMTVNFFQYRIQYADLKQFYTDEGWSRFYESMDPLATEMIKKKLSITAVLTGVPLLVREGPLPEGSYAWKFQMPILVSFESPSETVTQRQIVSVVVKRIPVDKDTGMRGIAVDSYSSTS